MNKHFIGDVVTRFYFGEMFKFKYVSGGDWVLESGNSVVPQALRVEFFNE